MQAVLNVMFFLRSMENSLTGLIVLEAVESVGIIAGSETWVSFLQIPRVIKKLPGDGKNQIIKLDTSVIIYNRYHRRQA